MLSALSTCMFFFVAQRVALESASLPRPLIARLPIITILGVVIILIMLCVSHALLALRPLAWHTRMGRKVARRSFCQLRLDLFR